MWGSRIDHDEVRRLLCSTVRLAFVSLIRQASNMRGESLLLGWIKRISLVVSGLCWNDACSTKTDLDVPR